MRVLARNLVVTMGKAGRSDPSRAAAPFAAPPASAPRRLLTARQVQLLLGIDRSTVYRMAEDGRLPGTRIGRQWRFPADRIEALLESAPPSTPAASELREGPGWVPAGINLDVARPVLDVAGYLLGVMMLVADMRGRPLTPVANPCAWYQDRSDDPDVMEACSAKWHAMAQDPDLHPRFRVGGLGVECAHAFIRSGNSLVGMVLAGGVAPASSAVPGLYRLTDEERLRVLLTLPRVAAALSRMPSREGVV